MRFRILANLGRISARRKYNNRRADSNHRRTKGHMSRRRSLLQLSANRAKNFLISTRNLSRRTRDNLTTRRTGRGRGSGNSSRINKGTRGGTINRPLRQFITDGYKNINILAKNSSLNRAATNRRRGRNNSRQL